MPPVKAASGIVLEPVPLAPSSDRLPRCSAAEHGTSVSTNRPVIPGTLAAPSTSDFHQPRPACCRVNDSAAEPHQGTPSFNMGIHAPAPPGLHARLKRESLARSFGAKHPCSVRQRRTVPVTPDHTFHRPPVPANDQRTIEMSLWAPPSLEGRFTYPQTHRRKMTTASQGRLNAPVARFAAWHVPRSPGYVPQVIHARDSSRPSTIPAGNGRLQENILWSPASPANPRTAWGS